jgi:tRNA-dihydrouridine synthase
MLYGMKTEKLPNRGFWGKQKKPFFALAPMANVTDFAFRQIIAKYGKPDVMWTGFISADGLVSTGRKKLLIDLKYSNKQRPIVAQLFSAHPDAMREAARLIKKLGFDGLDINMGCPDRAVEKQGGGAALMKNHEIAVEVLKAAREGVNTAPAALPTGRQAPVAGGDKCRLSRSGAERNEDTSSRRGGRGAIPVSIKTRLGYKEIDLGWIRTLLEQKLPALTVHLRTRKEMSDTPAHWELMPEIIKLRDKISPETLIIGNGDVETLEDAEKKAKKYGCDGIMIGRGVFGQPWLFKPLHAGGKLFYRRQMSLRLPRRLGNYATLSASTTLPPEERLRIMLEHAKLFAKTFKNRKNFATMRKHFKAYVSGWDGAKDLRVKLMNANNIKGVKDVVDKYLA